MNRGYRSKNSLIHRNGESLPQLEKSQSISHMIMPGEALYPKPIQNIERSVSFNPNVNRIVSLPQLYKSQSISHAIVPDEVLYPKPNQNKKQSVCLNPNSSRKSTRSIFTIPSRTNVNRISVKRMISSRKGTERGIFSMLRETDTGSSIIPGTHPPIMEARILAKMVHIALAKCEQGLCKESHCILRKVLDCQLVTLGPDDPQVARTFYYLGIVLHKLDLLEAALAAFENALQILFPTRHEDPNLDLAHVFYEISMIYGNRNKDYSTALYYLDLERQVEIHVLGSCQDTTLHLIEEYSVLNKIQQRRKSA